MADALRNSAFGSGRKRCVARVLSLSLLLWCAACIGAVNGGRYCVPKDEIGDTEYFSKKLPADREFFYTGVDVEAGQEFRISMTGAMNLCPGEASVDPGHASYPVTPKEQGWQQAPFGVRKNELFTVSLS